MRPYCASRSIIGAPRLATNQLRTRCDCAVTSGPMPSPPTTATLTMFERLFMRISLRGRSMVSRTVGCLKGANFIIALQCQRDFVESQQKAFAAALIDLEMVL